MESTKSQFRSDIEDYIRALTGSLAEIDTIIPGLMASWNVGQLHPEMTYGRRVRNFSLLHSRPVSRFERYNPTGNPTFQSAYQRLNVVDPHERSILLLKYLEGFSDDEISRILNVSERQIARDLIDSLAAVTSTSPSSALIISSDTATRAYLESISRRYGEVEFWDGTNVIPEVSADTVVLCDGLNDWVADTVLPSVQKSGAATILLNAADSISTSIDLVEISDLAAADLIEQTFIRLSYFRPFRDRPSSWPQLKPSPGINADALESWRDLADAEASLAPLPGPIQADVIDGMLRLSDDTVIIEGRGRLAVAGLQEDLLEDARRVAEMAHNVGTGFAVRMNRVCTFLEQPTSEPVLLRLGAQARALLLMRDAIYETMMGARAADTWGFVNALAEYLAQFPEWQRFQEDAQLSKPIIADELDAIRSLASQIAKHRGQIVDDPLVVALEQIVPQQGDKPDTVQSLIIRRGIANVVKAIGRYLIGRSTGSVDAFNKQLDKRVGAGMADTFIDLIVGSGAMLLLLASSAPREFGWAIPLLLFIKRRK